MGFRVPKRTEIVLEFTDDDPDLAELSGLTVRCRSMSIAEAEAVDEQIREGKLTEVLADSVIVSWDMVDERNKPVPVSAEGFGDLPPWVPQTIYRAWVRGLLTPPKASPAVSRNGRGSAT